MRTKNSLKNFIYGVVPTIIVAILGIVKMKIFILYLGDQTVGIYQLFAQIFSYLALADAGLTSSVLYYLYKPISENDYARVNSILAGAKSFFNKVALAIMVVGIFICFNIMFFVKETSLSLPYIQVCFYIYLLSNIINYFVIAHVTLFEAEQKLYKQYKIFYTFNILKSIIEICLVLAGYNLLEIVFSYLILSVIQNLLSMRMSKKDHDFLDLKVQKDYCFLKQTKNLIVEKLGALVFNNIDIILISKYLGLTEVVVYTSYNYVINNLYLMINKISSATLSSVGNLLVAEKERASAIFHEYNSFAFFIANILIAPVIFSISPFVRIVYGEAYQTGFWTMLLFVGLLYLNIIRMVLDVFVQASGSFKEIKNCVILESIINFTLSFILVKTMGISGVLLATMIAFLFGRFRIYPKIIHHNVLQQKVSGYYIDFIKYFTCTVMNVIFINFVFQNIEITNLFNWMLFGALIFVINFATTIGYFYLIKELTFMDRLISVLKPGKKTEE